jgi:hypothetical protein
MNYYDCDECPLIERLKDAEEELEHLEIRHQKHLKKLEHLRIERDAAFAELRLYARYDNNQQP